MTEHEFNNKYNPWKRCTAVYKDSWGYNIKGLLLDGIQTSTCGNKFLYINSFANGVNLSDIVDVIDTGKPWVKEGEK